MRSLHHLIPTLMMAASAMALTACSDKTSGDKAPSLNEVTSSQSVEAAKQVVLEQARPKADKSVPASDYVAFNSGNQLMYLYLGLSGMPIDYRDIVGKVSAEYRQTNDEFRKSDLLKALQPQIDASVAQARTQRYFKIDISYPIGKYDFEKNGFPVDNSVWESGSYRYFNDNSQYHVGFTNGEAFRYLTNIPEESARNIERLRATYNGVKMVVYGFAQAVDMSNTTVQAEIVGIELVDNKGNVLARQ